MAEITRKELILALISAGDHLRLGGLDLTGLDLSEIDLSGADLHHINLSAANLPGVYLSIDVLADTILTGVVMPDGSRHE